MATVKARVPHNSQGQRTWSITRKGSSARRSPNAALALGAGAGESSSGW
jgi:hypothetical protein